jgi:autoinducer 2-degrading protein
MHVTLVQIRVSPEHVDAFIDATRANHEASIREAGNLRFDVLRVSGDPTRFALYEAYVDEAAARAHKETAHYEEWRSLAEPMMAEPRTRVSYDGLYPEVAGAGG